MKTRLTIGGELDMLTPDELHDAIGGLRDSLTPKGKIRPVRRRLFKAMLTTTSSAPYLAFGGPAVGRIWFVTSVCAMGVDQHTTSAVVNWVGVGQPEIDDVSQVIGTGQTTPYTWMWSRETQWVMPGEQLYLGFSGTGAGTHVAATATIYDYPDSAVEASDV